MNASLNLYMYKYTVNAKGYFEKIKVANDFNKEEFTFLVNDMLSEFFYYGNESFIHNYYAKFNIDIDDCYYTIKYFVYSHDGDLMEKFKKDYDETLMNFDELLCINGCDDDFYSDNKIENFFVKNVKIDYFIEKVSKHDYYKSIDKLCDGDCYEYKMDTNYNICKFIYKKYKKSVFHDEKNVIQTFEKICKLNDSVVNDNYELKINIELNKTIFDESGDLFFDDGTLNKIFLKITKKYRTKKEYSLCNDKELYQNCPTNIKNKYMYVFNNIKFGEIFIDNEKHMDIYMSLDNGKILFFDIMENFVFWIVDINSYDFIEKFKGLKINKKFKLSFFHDNFYYTCVDEEDLCY